jgi:hypothetical protein
MQQIFTDCYCRVSVLERRYGHLDRIKTVDALTGCMYSCENGVFVG